MAGPCENFFGSGGIAVTRGIDDIGSVWCRFDFDA